VKATGERGTLKLMGYELRPATPEDSAFLEQLYTEVHAPQFAAAGLPEAALAQLMRMQFQAQRTGYAAQFPGAQSSIVWANGFRIGRLLVHETPDDVRLVDIALTAPLRGFHIGTQLIEGVCEAARQKGLPARLSVQPGNPAARLYERLGFVAVGGHSLDCEMEWRPTGPNLPQDQPAESETQQPAAGEVEPATTAAFFRSVVGKSAQVSVEGGEPVEITLVAVEPFGPPAADSFALVLETAADRPLGQGVYPLAFGDYQPMDIFLTPTACDSRMKYEAIFNRDIPPAKPSLVDAL
jgi:GNAT superfamily N-acetyltransferase